VIRLNSIKSVAAITATLLSFTLLPPQANAERLVVGDKIIEIDCPYAPDMGRCQTGTKYRVIQKDYDAVNKCLSFDIIARYGIDSDEVDGCTAIIISIHPAFTSIQKFGTKISKEILANDQLLRFTIPKFPRYSRPMGLPPNRFTIYQLDQAKYAHYIKYGGDYYDEYNTLSPSYLHKFRKWWCDRAPTNISSDMNEIEIGRVEYCRSFLNSYVPIKKIQRTAEPGQSTVNEKTETNNQTNKESHKICKKVMDYEGCMRYQGSK